ncbi:MAG: hypothetical protein JOS17DRAFT_68769 [Linnemannia elongata]|nr:MAG: hypothetical protein JOS17DRAFT_68769 [Linnemannia elongata]
MWSTLQKRKSKTRWADQSNYSCTPLSFMHYRSMTFFTTLAHTLSHPFHPRLSRISLVRKRNLSATALFILYVCDAQPWIYLSSFQTFMCVIFFCLLLFACISITSPHSALCSASLTP